MMFIFCVIESSFESYRMNHVENWLKVVVEELKKKKIQIKKS